MACMDVDELLDYLMVVAMQQDAYIHNICFRRAGVGIMWYEPARCKSLTAKEVNEMPVMEHRGLTKKQRDAWKEGLVVYQYGEDLQDCLVKEIERLEQKQEETPTPSHLKLIP